MSKITIVLEYEDKSTIEVDVDIGIVAEASILEYKREFFVFSSMNSTSLHRPKFVKVKQPAFIG